MVPTFRSSKAGRAEDVFDTILKSKADGEKPEVTPKKEPQRELKFSGSSPGPFVCTLQGEAYDDALLKAAAEAPPLSKGGKSQQQRLNAVKPKKGQKAMKSSKPKTQKEAASSTKAAASKAKSQPKAKSGIKKKPSCQSVESPDPPKKQQKSEAVASPDTPKKKKKYKRGKPTSELDPTNPEERKLLKKRLESWAWHSTYDKCISEGKSKEEARQAGREASLASVSGLLKRTL